MVHRPLVPTSWFSRPGADSVRGLSSLDQVLEQLLLDPDFRRSLSSDQIRECGSLLQERDPALLAEAVFSLGHQLERSEALQAAIEIYQALGSSVGAGALQARARGRLDAILGQGPVQNRLEDLGRRFVRQATEPSAIFSFAIAGGIAGMVRSSVLSGLALRAPSFWTRGLMARGLAGTAAYLAEVPAFVGAGRFSRALISNPGAGAGEPSLSQEFSGAAIFLGVLKFGGFLGQASFGRLTRNELLRGLGGSLSQVGSIYLGHRLQEFAGLRPGHGEANRWVDSLDAWLQMRVGGRLLGHSSEASRREMGLLASLETRGESDFSAGSIFRRPSSRASQRIAASYEEAPLKGFPGIGEAVSFSPDRQLMIQRWGLDSVRRFSRELEGVARLLGVSVQALDRLHVDSRIQESEVLEAGWLRFHYMLRHSDTAGSRGSYVNWISRLMLEEAVDRGEAFRLDSMFEKLHAGCGLAEWERLGAELFPDYDIFTASKVTGSRPPFAPVYAFSFFRQVESLPIHPDARRALRQFLRHQDEIPEGVLPRLTQHLRAHPEFVSSVEEALAVARNSPLGYLRILRLFSIFQAESPLYPHVLELGDANIQLRPFRHDGLPLDWPVFGTQHDAYLADTRFSGFLAEFFRDWRTQRRSMQHALRATQTWELLLNLWPTPRPLVSEDIVRALESLYDPMATDLARAIRHRDFTLRIVDDAEFNRLVRQISGDERGEFWSGFTVRGDPYFYPMDTITIRQIQNVSGAVFPELVFERLVTLIHEYEHHLHRSLADSPQISQLNEEMSAHLRHLHFRSRQGFTESIDDILKVSPLGLGMYLRDRIESSYLQRSLAPRVRSLELLDSSEGARRERIEDSAHYSRGLLDLSLDRLLAVLRRGTTAGEDRGPVRDWLMEARRVLEEQRKDLGEWIESKEGVPTPYLEAASYRYVDFARVWEQLTETLNLLAEEPSTAKLSLIRRRLDWVLYDGGHGRAWDWNEVPWFLRLTETTPPAEDRLAYGRHLLERFHPNPTSEDFDLLEAAAGGPIRGRDIAFDLDDTLGDTVARHVAEKIHGLDPGRYDQDPRESVHQLQRVRAVYRHMQALLLGLWASGNRLRLFTASDNYAGNHDAFFNDYPALKVAFGLASPEGPEVLLRSADLDQSPHFMDRLKYQRRYAELFSGESGRRFLQNVRTERSLGESRGFRSAKLPTPGFPFEVLVDDLQGFGVELREAGFGERWVRAQGNGLRQWSSLVEFFSSPREPAMDLWNRWLSEEYEE